MQEKPGLIAECHRLVRDGIANERKKLTQMIPREGTEEILYPSGKIDRPFLQVACSPELYERINYTEMPRPWMRNYEVFTLKAEQFALVLPDGHKVVWWGWKMA